MTPQKRVLMQSKYLNHIRQNGSDLPTISLINYISIKYFIEQLGLEKVLAYLPKSAEMAS